MNERNWAEIGIAWVDGDVEKGDTKLTLCKAQIPMVVDLDLVIAHFGRDTMRDSINASNSWRVAAQDVARTYISRGGRDVVALRELVYNRLRGIRSAATVTTKVVEVKVYNLPNGTTIKTESLIELQQAFVAAMHDAGVPNDVAIAMSQKLTL